MKPTNVKVIANTYINVYRAELAEAELNQELTLEIIAEDGMTPELEEILKHWTNECIRYTEIIASFLKES